MVDEPARLPARHPREQLWRAVRRRSAPAAGVRGTPSPHKQGGAEGAARFSDQIGLECGVRPKGRARCSAVEAPEVSLRPGLGRAAVEQNSQHSGSSSRLGPRVAAVSARDSTSSTRGFQETPTTGRSFTGRRCDYTSSRSRALQRRTWWSHLARRLRMPTPAPERSNRSGAGAQSLS